MRGHTLSIVFLSENLKIYLTQEEGGGGIEERNQSEDNK